MSYRDVRIKVIKKLETDEVFEEYAGENARPSCPALNVGDEFVSRNMGMPEGFCSWAWADIHRDVVHLSMGGEFSWIKGEGRMVSCCTDGLRPVLFELKRL
ncbi:MAG: TIGR04076 family protein [Candidatus Bathyarchaeota archaeon]|nr:MAG: TIGR04076 family protein [Candidatus Bathyarchaeota archaeon]